MTVKTSRSSLSTRERMTAASKTPLARYVIVTHQRSRANEQKKRTASGSLSRTCRVAVDRLRLTLLGTTTAQKQYSRSSRSVYYCSLVACCLSSPARSTCRTSPAPQSLWAASSLSSMPSILTSYFVPPIARKTEARAQAASASGTYTCESENREGFKKCYSTAGRDRACCRGRGLHPRCESTTAALHTALETTSYIKYYQVLV